MRSYLCGEDGGKVVRLGAEDAGPGVGEELHARQLRHHAVAGDADGVAQQVAGEVLLQVVARVHVPVLIGDPVHLLHAIDALRALEHVVQHAQVLVPQRHPEAVDLAPGRLPVG